MKKIVFILSLISMSVIVACDNGNAMITIVDQEQKPIKAVQDLAKLTGIIYDGSLQDLVTKTQKEQPQGWMRAAGKERWEVEDFFASYAHQADSIFDKELHMKQALYPCKKQYDYATIHGGLLKRMRKRLAFLINCWNAGVRFNALIIWCGQRPLDPIQESEATLYDAENGIVPFNENWKNTDQKMMYESDMAKLIIEQTMLPKEWGTTIPIIFAVAPGYVNEKGIWVRPTTQETIKTWLATNPKPGTILAVSSQPHAGYQHAITKKLLPKTYELETIGFTAEHDEKISIYFDALARWLYALN